MTDKELKERQMKTKTITVEVEVPSRGCYGCKFLLDIDRHYDQYCYLFDIPKKSWDRKEYHKCPECLAKTEGK